MGHQIALESEINPLNASVALIQKPVKWFENQLTGFYMRATLAFNGLASITFWSVSPNSVKLGTITIQHIRKKLREKVHLQLLLMTSSILIQLAITCSKLGMETLEQGVKYVQS